MINTIIVVVSYSGQLLKSSLWFFHKSKLSKTLATTLLAGNRRLHGGKLSVMSRTSATSTTPSRVRAANSHYSVISRTRAQDDSSKPKSSGHDPAKNRRSSLLKRANSREEDTAVLAPQRARSVNRPAVVEQFGCPRRQISRRSDEAAMTAAAAAAAEEDEKRKKMEEKLGVNESLIKDLQAQVLSLKTELEEARNSNTELELKNKKLSQDLVSAEAKISSLSSNDKVTSYIISSLFRAGLICYSGRPSDSGDCVRFSKNFNEIFFNINMGVYRPMFYWVLPRTGNVASALT